MSLTIRRATHSDLSALLALYSHLDPKDDIPTIEQASERLEQLTRYHGSCILIGLADDILVSSCTLIVIPNLTRGGQLYALIENVVTHTSHRGQGYGKAMLREAVACAWQADCYKVMLMTGSKRPSTLAFYETAGFEQSKTGFQIRRLPPRQDIQ